jgi:hypothetical protein
MGNLFFPQLLSGALAQYPLRRARYGRSIKNVLPSGDLIVSPDPWATVLEWELSYSALAAADLEALQTLFQACAGPLRAFSFIDPVDNMLAGSAAFAPPFWNIPGPISIVPGAPDPMGTVSAFVFTNSGQAPLAVTQSLNVPASYQYCFSAYVFSNQSSAVTLVRQGVTSQALTPCSIGPSWSRIVSSGALSDTSTGMTVGIQLSPGQQITVYGPQLEAQPAPSRYRAASQSGGVYSNAHWGTNQLLVTAQAPNLFSITFTIETAIQD